MPEYVAALCRMDGTQVVPYESLNIVAKDDEQAIRQAVRWRGATITTIDRDTWLQVLRDGRAIFSKAIGGA